MSPVADLYGPIVDGGRIERDAIATLKDYLSAYLAEVERQNEIEPGTLERVRSFAIGARFTHDADDQLPAVTLIAPGLADTPRRAGDGTYRADWALGVAVLVAEPGEGDAAKDVAKLYTAAIRACLLQRAGNIGEAVDWRDERYDDLDDRENDRTLGVGQVVLSVEVAGVVSARGGPLAAPPDPLADPAEYTVVDTTIVTTSPQP